MAFLASDKLIRFLVMKPRLWTAMSLQHGGMKRGHVAIKIEE